MSSEHLRVVVHKDGQETVNLTMPIYSLRIIETIMPDGVLEKLKTRNIDLNLLLRVARESNYEPQEIFHEEFQDSEHLKSYRVWIE